MLAHNPGRATTTNLELLLARGWRGRADQIANVKDTGAVSLSEIGGVQGQEILEISSRRFCR